MTDERPAPDDREDDLEPERYELRGPSAYRFEVERRAFLGTLGGGLLVVWLPRRAAAQERPGRVPEEIGAWLRMDPEGGVTVFTGKVEVGQDIRTSLTQAVAEELRAPLDTIQLVMGDTDLVPFDRGTFGSRTTPVMAPQLRKVAAAAREALLDLAATEWRVAREELAVAEGRVIHRSSGRAAGFGALAKGRKLVRNVEEAAVTPAERWTVAGRSIPKVNGRALVTGQHRFTSDMTRPGLRHGKVLRPPTVGATLSSVDTTAAAALPGVTVVHDGEFVGVAAPSALLAGRALGKVRAEWKPAPSPPSAATIFEVLRPPRTPQDDDAAEGSPTPEGTVRRQARYTVAYIAHAPLEPRAAVAEWNDGRLTVWTGTQRPFGVRSQLAEAFRLSEDKVRVIVPDTGSGYGGKHTGEAAVEAARLAKAAGQPVKVVWTREEEFTGAYFRPAGVIDVRSAAGPDGKLREWVFDNANSGTAGLRTPYDVPEPQVTFHPRESPLRQGSYRGLAATANHFARETHMDELAAALSLDPLEFRRRNLKDDRLRAVLDAATDRFGWPGSRTAGRGYGLAAGLEKGSFVATCAEIAVEETTRKVSVVRLVAAFECGAIVHPDHLKSQVEGCLVQGLGGALFEAVDFAEGRIVTTGFSSYRVPRFRDVPRLDVVLLDRKDLPSVGAGETPIVCVAPAIGNAIFQATGQRVRALPLTPAGVVPEGSGPPAGPKTGV